MPMQHEDTYGYPTLAQAAPQAQLLLQLATGSADPALTLNDKIKSAHTVASFGLSMAFPHDHSAAGPGDLEPFRALSAHATGGAMSAEAAIDWKSIVKMALAFLATLLG